MKIIFRYTSLFLIQILSFYGFGQISGEDDLKEVFFNSRKYNKNLIIYRYDSVAVNYARISKKQSVDYFIDSLLKSLLIPNSIERDFIFFPVNIYTKKTEELDFLDNFYYDFTPNFIIFSPDSNLISYTNYSGRLLNYDINLIDELSDSIYRDYDDVLKRDKLVLKFQSGIITTQEIIDLIFLKSKFNLKSKNLLNWYALNQGELTSDLYSIIVKQNINSTDPIVEYFLRSEKKEDENWEYYKMGIIEHLLENAKGNFDKIEFENTMNLKENYQKILIKKNADNDSDIFNISPALNVFKENQYIDKLYFYLSISDSSSFISTGSEFADFIIESFDKNLKEQVAIQMNIFDAISSMNLYSSDSIATYEKKNYKINRSNLEAREVNKFLNRTSEYLNLIYWNCYIYTTNSVILNRALRWSEFAISIFPTIDNIHTYSHILFTIGYKNKAIKYQKKALKLARNSSDSISRVDKLNAELIQFKSSKSIGK